ncbi:hypothetical protein [Chlamydia suis]|uniref:hypothetical protein n=1 Tax=Chlamydia suis TaxID=83559 RepID=UPI0009B132F9|nr:hypothetical protein [Chlamydia suis]
MVIPKVDLGESAVMMGYKLTSQLAMLSILLTFTHNVGHANQVSQALPAAIETQAIVEEKEGSQTVEKGVAGQVVKEVLEESTSSEEGKFCKIPSKRAFFSGITNGVFSGNHEQRLAAKKENKVRGNKPQEVSQTAKRRGQSQSEKEFFDWLCHSKKADKQKIREKKSKAATAATAAQAEESCPKVAAIAAARASLSPEEKLQLIREWLAEEKTARKSGRAACRVTDKIKRDGSITSTLRYDAEKALATKVRRNESSVSSKARQRAAHQRIRTREVKKAAVENKTKVEERVADSARDQVKRPSEGEKNAAPENYFAATASTNNTNVVSYLNARQYRCDSSETDWPCSSCVAKRRANFGISVCTMVVTVIAMIVGAVIISNATDSTVAGASGTPGGGATQP